MSEQRQNVNIELSESNKERLKQIRAQNGMTQKVIISRMVDWFCDQDATVQALVLGQIPSEIAPDVAQIVLKRMAAVEPDMTNESGRGLGRIDDSAGATGAATGAEAKIVEID